MARQRLEFCLRTSRLDFRRSLVSGLLPPREVCSSAFGGGARAPLPNSGW